MREPVSLFPVTISTILGNRYYRYSHSRGESVKAKRNQADLLMTTQMVTYGDQDQSPACRRAGARTQVCRKLPVDFGSSEGRGLWDVIYSSVDQEILLSPYLCLSSPYCCLSLLSPRGPQGVQNTWAVFLKLLCQNHLEGFQNTGCRLPPQVSHSVGLGCGPAICISNSFTSDAVGVVWGPHFRTCGLSR